MCQIRINAQTFQMADYVDLIHLAGLISRNITDAQIKSTANAVISATESSIIAAASHGTAVKNAHGLSIWFPAVSDLYFNYRAKYLELKCNRSPFGWREFLDAYHSWPDKIDSTLLMITYKHPPIHWRIIIN